MNGAPNPNRHSMAPNVTGLKTSSEVTISNVPVNSNGGPIQSAQNRQKQPPPQGQMVAQNRQPTQNQMSASSQLQKLSHLTVKQIRKAFFL